MKANEIDQHANNTVPVESMDTLLKLYSDTIGFSLTKKSRRRTTDIYFR